METLKSFAPLTAAEEKLLAEYANPARITVGDGGLPEEATADCSIRAGLLRYVLLATGQTALDGKGLRLRGARIKGALDLQGCDCNRDITLSHCSLDEPLSLVNATLRGLHISNSQIKGISADNASFSGSLYIRAGTVIEGEIGLAGARIKGALQLCDVVINPSGQDAVFAPSLRVEGSVFLGNYPYADGTTTLTANGTLFFSSARIEHDFFVSNVAISPLDSVISEAVFGATEEHGSDMALSLARARIGGLLYFQDNQVSRGIVNLAGATVARLKDEPVGPGANYPVRLDGFRYKDFSRHTDTLVASRLAWLDRRPDGTPFTTQPYEQLAYVLTQIGHRNDAQTILMSKEKRQRAENRALLKQAGRPIRWGLSGFADVVLRFTVGYGYRPARAVGLAILLIFGLGMFFQAAWRAGDMTPNAAPILVSPPWIEATKLHPNNPSGFWSGVGQAGQDWETFYGFAYAADLVIPIVNLGQENAWAPSTSRSPLGRIGWWLRWIAKGVGWVVTALAAGAITGIIRKD